MVVTSMTLLIPAFSLLGPPPVFAVWLLRQQERSPTNPFLLRFHSFGTMLKPRYVLGAPPLDQ